VDEYLLRTSPGGIRAAVQKRDHGICAECGLPCDRCCPVVGQYTGGWAADHIVPVWRGGGECGLDNLQTLCVPCHRQKTAREAAERAALNRPEPLPSLQLEMAL
jgi:5-methylcytosine-specific restriction endonuclease McrA